MGINTSLSNVPQGAASEPSSPASTTSEYFDAESHSSSDIESTPSSPTFSSYHDALSHQSSPTAELSGAGKQEAGYAAIFLDSFSDDVGTSGISQDRVEDDRGSIRALRSSGIEMKFGWLAKTRKPEIKTGNPAIDVPKLKPQELLQAADEHYGTEKWNSEYAPYLTSGQQNAVDRHIDEIDVEEGLRPPRNGASRMIQQMTAATASGPSAPPATAKLDRMSVARIAARRKAAGSLTPNLDAHVAYWTKNPGRLIGLAKDLIKPGKRTPNT